MHHPVVKTGRDGKGLPLWVVIWDGLNSNLNLTEVVSG